MGNWRDALPSQYLKAGDFEQPKLLTIKSYVLDKVGDDPKGIVYFKEVEKGLVLNITNGTTIEEIAGTSDTEHWLNTKVVLFKTQTDYQGKRVDCIRVRRPKPGATIPVVVEPEPDDDVPF